MIYRAEQLKDKLPTLSEEEKVALLATNGMLVKRPILILDDIVLVGFKEAEWKEALTKDPNSTDNPYGVPNYLAYPSTQWSDYLFNVSST